MKRLILNLLILVLLQGCTSEVVKKESGQTPFAELNQLLIDENVTDARFQHVKSYDFFQITLPLRYQINQYDELTGLQDKKHFISKFIIKAADEGERATSLALTRLPTENLVAFRQDHPYLVNGPDTNRPLMDIYRQHAERSLKKEQDRIHAMATEADLDLYWSTFVEGIEESIMTKDRLKRELETFYAVPFIKLWIAYHEATDNRGPVAVSFTNTEIYSPRLTNIRPSGISPGDWELLQENSPVIVHEIDPDAAYSIENDRFGRVLLQGRDLEEATPVVDTTRPVVYSYVDEKKIQGTWVKQLVYTIIHPAHPQLSKLDPEAGIFDGWTVRISLDHKNRPLIFESVSNCGCYYKIFPSDRLEKSGQKAFTKKLKDKQFYVENIVEGKYDAVVPELVKGNDKTTPSNAVLYYSAGHHQLVTIRSKQQAELLEKGFKEKTYTLRPYDGLENLPFNGYRASLFDTDGLVRKAHRPECKLLKPSGLYHAGHPRQRETQMIYFDEAQFDDPGLLETYLRLPPDVFGLTK